MGLGGGKMGTLPNSNNVIIPIEKFTEYALNPLKQKDKAKAFEKALGYNLGNYQKLIDNIRFNVPNYLATPKPNLGYGQRYQIIMDLLGENGKKAKVLTAWIVDETMNAARLISAYVDDE